MSFPPPVLNETCDLNLIVDMEGETEVVQCAVPEDTAVLIEDPALELAIQGEHLCKEGRWEEGISCLEEALAASPTDPEALSALYSQLGHAYFYVKRYDRALDVYSQALANARRSGQRKEEAQAAANMTNTLRFMGNYRYAAEFGQLYLDMCREMKDVVSFAGQVGEEGRDIEEVAVRVVFSANGAELGCV